MENQTINNRDYSKIDGIPNERWALAEIIFSSRKRSAWGNSINSTPPLRKGYLHEKQVADFDMALDCAKAVIEAGWHL